MGAKVANMNVFWETLCRQCDWIGGNQRHHNRLLWGLVKAKPKWYYEDPSDEFVYRVLCMCNPTDAHDLLYSASIINEIASKHPIAEVYQGFVEECKEFIAICSRKLSL